MQTESNTPSTAAAETHDLLPCPFCGSAEVENWASRPRDRGHDVWCVFCHVCLCEGPEALTEAEAATAWNTRVNSIAELERERDALKTAVLGVRNGMGCWCITPFVNISEGREHEDRCKAVFAALGETK